MKIFFIESRFKTEFWDNIALELEQDGHQIYWIIQNHFFFPKSGKKIVLSYPKKEFNFTQKEYIQDIINSDKIFTSINKKDINYFYHYDMEIEKIVKSEYPDVIFGDKEFFHEKITLYHAKINDIPYLSLHQIAFPIGRFSFYKNGENIPYFGSRELLKNVDELLESYQNQNSHSERLKLKKYDKFYKMKTDSLNNIITTLSYFSGEKYNINHPAIKLIIEIQKKRNILIWENISKKDIKILKKMRLLKYSTQLRII